MNRVRTLLRTDQRGVAALPAWGPYALAVVGLVVLLALVVVGFRVARPGVLPGVTMDGRDVSGLSADELAVVVEEYHAERAGEDFTVVLDVEDHDGPAAPSGEVTSDRADLGFAVDTDATHQRVWRRGRQLNPFAALRDQFRAFGDGFEVNPVVEVDGEELEGWVSASADEFDVEPDEGSLEVSADGVAHSEPRSGVEVDQPALASQARAHVLLDGPQTIDAPASAVHPETDPAELAALADNAERVVSGPVHLSREGATLELSATDLGELVDVEGSGPDRALAIDPSELDARVDDDTRAALETDPVDAEIYLSGGEVVIDESTDGFRFDAEVAGEQVLELATAEASDGETPREAALDGEITEPDRTTEDAEALGITEQIASFTTEHACCQGRVQNIQRMADLVDGVLVEPGESFSINEHVGPRTREKGFTEGGIIIGGEFEDAVGGGVSQFATTFFNAVFFGGYEILEHQPHSYYISRYPVGREATLNYPNLDVAFRNDSPYGVLISTSYTGTSITVSLWATDWVDVDAITGERQNIRQPPVEYEENSNLPPGSEQVVQSGRTGFTVSYTRLLDYHDGGEDRQTWTHTYQPEPRIIERNTDEPAPEPDDTDEPDDEPDDDEPDDEPDDDQPDDDQPDDDQPEADTADGGGESAS